MLSWIFSTLLQSSVSHDPSEIKLICRFAVLLLSVLKTVVMLQIITMIHFFMTCWSQKSSIFCSIINAFTVTLINLMHPCWIKVKKKVIIYHVMFINVSVCIVAACLVVRSSETGLYWGRTLQRKPPSQPAGTPETAVGHPRGGHLKCFVHFKHALLSSDS